MITTTTVDLEPVSKPSFPLFGVEADQGTAEMEERLVDVRAPLVAHRQSLELIQPREVPLHHPPVSPQSLLRLDPSPRDPGDDVPRPQRPPVHREVVSLVRVQLARSLAPP